MIELLIASFVAGILTILAPCILPLLPVIVGGSTVYDNSKKEVSLKHPLIIIASLAGSIIIFSLLLKFTTVLLGVPAGVWAMVSGTIVLLFGINLLVPQLWEKIMQTTGFALMATRLMGASQQRRGVGRDILLGAALGPVFNSCSPTYALIIAIILPASFTAGLSYLAAYAFGLGLILLLISAFGRVVVNKMKWMSDPRGLFQKTIGTIFVIVGLCVIFGVDKQAQAYILENGWYTPISQLEETLRR